MRTGEILRRSFGAMQAGPLWAFLLTGVAATGIPVAAMTAVAWMASGSVFSDYGSASPDQALAEMSRVYAVLAVAALVSLPFVIVVEGGLVHAADGALTGRSEPPAPPVPPDEGSRS